MAGAGVRGEPAPGAGDPPGARGCEPLNRHVRDRAGRAMHRIGVLTIPHVDRRCNGTTPGPGAVIRLDDVELRRGGVKVLDRASLVVQRRQKVGVVGANGAGKTSLLGVLLGELEPDRGDVEVPAGIATATVAQEAPAGEIPLIDYVTCGDPRIASIRARLADAETRGDAGGQAAAHADLEAIHGYAAEAQANRILRGLGFAPGDESRALDALSGGWRMRAALARTLAAPSELLLLDEPTNHLDLDAIVWLEAWLRRYPRNAPAHLPRPGISRSESSITSRWSVTDAFWSIPETTARSNGFAPSSWSTRAARRHVSTASGLESRCSSTGSATRRARRGRRRAGSRRSNGCRWSSRSTGKDGSPSSSSSPSVHPRPTTTLESVSFGYGDRTVLSDVSMTLAPGDRIALLGANGMGKSTLLRGLAGRLAPMDGTLAHSPWARIGYFAQHRVEQLDLHRTPLELARGIAPGMREQEMRDFLGGFGFGYVAATNRVAPLSGGEKTRLAIALLILERPNLLLLDEPSNHLDLDMREALIASLQSFSGALVLVSHDRHLLRLVSDALWLVADGRVAPFRGDIDDYGRWLADRHAEPALDEPRSLGATTARARRERRRMHAEERRRAAPLRREIEALERRLGALNEERTSIESVLSGAGIYRENERARLRDLLVRRARLDEEIAVIESTWMEKNEQLDAMDDAGMSASGGMQ